MNASVAKAAVHGPAPSFAREGQGRRCSGFVTDHHIVIRQRADSLTLPPFALPMLAHQMRDSVPLGCGRHHFLPKRSFKAA